MVKPLPSTDFRAVRMMLEPDDFALPGETVPPTDLIRQDTWHEIMDLPDHVAVEISDHHGGAFSLLQALWGEWLEAMSGEHDALFETMLDAADCLQSSTFDFLHGYFRSSISNLRSALELIAVGVLGNVCPDDEVYLLWKDGSADLAFPASRRRLHRRLKKGYAGLLLHDGWAIKQYYEMCGYAHSRPRTSDGDLWNSNGPVYNGEAISKVMGMQLFTYASCYLLVRIGRPRFVIPPESAALFERHEFPWCADVRGAYAELYLA
jgi:hypothetical protein